MSEPGPATDDDATRAATAGGRHPRVSVLMPAYNAAAYLRDAVASILSQDFADFELLIIDDGSTDGTGTIADQLTRTDQRIRVVHQQNRGLIATLNAGLPLPRGQYTARMDADDLSLPQRLRLQTAYLAEHPEVAAVGSSYETFGGAQRRWTLPAEPRFVRAAMLFRSALSHGAAMLRTSLFREEALRYDPAFLHAEDYHLWSQILTRHELANLPDVLLRVRRHGDQVSQRFTVAQQASAAKVRRILLDRLGVPPTDEEAAVHEALAADRPPPDPAFVAQAGRWLARLHAANAQCPQYDAFALGKILSARWAAACLAAAPAHPEVWRAFHASPLAAFVDRSERRFHAIPPPGT